MIKKTLSKSLFLLLFSFLNLTHYSFADQLLIDGTFQAYWKAEWNDDATVNTPQLGFRYFPSETSPQKMKVIDILMDGSENKKINFIKSHFTNIPDNFFKYKEWYVNQKGYLTIKEIKHYIECDADNYIAEFVSFTPTALNFNTKTNDDTGCVYGGSFPYLTSYVLNSNTKTGQLKHEPKERAKTSYIFTRDESVVKIKTINKEWMYVALYDPTRQDRLSDKKGYIKFSDVVPLN